MTIIGSIGATCLGIVIGWLVRYFIRRFTRFTPMVLGSVLSIVLGGAVLKFLAADKSLWAFYPTGLLLGFVLYHFSALSAAGGSRGSGPRWKFPDKSNPWFLGRK